MDKFIYVFNTAARDYLEQAGFLLLKADEHNSIFVFALGTGLNFQALQDDFEYVTLNTLTF